MLKTRRQIRTEEDRFGGYIEEPTSFRTNENHFEIDDGNASHTYYADVPAPASRYETGEIVRYSQRRDIDNETEYVGGYHAPSVRRSVRRDPESIMPSLKTRDVLKTEEKEQVRSQSKSSMPAKAKVMLGVYAAVVVVLAAIVIATGIVIGNMGSSVASLQEEISYRNQVVAEQSMELSTLSDENAIRGRAEELGMQTPTSAVEVELLPMGETVSYETRTNWFDKFCDWLSNLIGG